MMKIILVCISAFCVAAAIALWTLALRGDSITSHPAVAKIRASLGGAIPYQTGTLLKSGWVPCIQAPRIVAGGRAHTCTSLKCGKTCLSCHSFFELDLSHCAPLMRAGPELEERKALLEPIRLRLRPDTTDQAVFRQLYCDGHFDFLHLLYTLIPPGRDVTFLDAGANIGIASLLVAAAAEFRIHVVAIEAEPGNARALAANVAPLGGRVQVVPAALTGAVAAMRGDTLTFVGRAGAEWGYHVLWANDKPAEQYAKRVDVPAKSIPQLEALVPGNRFDFIKLDIEGQELNVLTEPRSKAALCRSRCIFMELHEGLQPGCNKAFNDFLAGGCPGGEGERFRQVTFTGEYRLLCKKRVLQERTGC